MTSNSYIIILLEHFNIGLAQALCVIASETWSSVASPMQDIACSAFSLKSFDLQQYLIDCANIHHAIGAWYVGHEVIFLLLKANNDNYKKLYIGNTVREAPIFPE